MSVFGTRPEAIKMAPIIKEIEKRSDRFDNVVVLTGQHKEMLNQVMNVFNISEDYNLDIMKQGQSLNGIMAEIFKKLPVIIQKENPDVLLVHGDTTTTLASSIVGFNEKIKIGHVEAGLRTWDLESPFPEEANRQVTDQIATYYFPPTQLSKQNLLVNKHLNNENIIVTGNTAIDALKYTTSIKTDLPFVMVNPSNRLIVLTMHRRENWGNPMRSVFESIKKIVNDFSDVEVVFPVHLNPIVRSLAHEYFDVEKKVHLIDPLEPVEFHGLLNKAFLVMSDSGGVQEEAPSLKKPVLVLRESTERPEGIEAGTLKLVGTDNKYIYDITSELLLNDDEYNRMANSPNPYGDGKASERILDFLDSKF